MSRSSSNLVSFAIATLSAFTAVFATALAQSSVSTPLDNDYYAEFMRRYDDRSGPGMPEVSVGTLGGKITIRFLRDKLEDMREHRDRLRDRCLGSHGLGQIETISGRKVLLNPEWMRQCEWSAKFLSDGVGALDQAFPIWNKAAGTNYPSPRGDKSDLLAWTERKATFLYFSDICNIGSQKMRYPLARAGGESDKAVYDSYAALCPQAWRELFNPAGASKDKENASGAAASSSNRDGNTAGAGSTAPKPVTEEKSSIPRNVQTGGDASLEKELGAVSRGEYSRQVSSQQVDEARRAIAERRTSGTLVESLEKEVANQPKAGSIGGVEIFGGKTGKLLETLSDPAALQRLVDEESASATTNSKSTNTSVTSTCDAAAYAAEGQALVRRNAPVLSQLPTEAMSCASARLHLHALRSDLAFANRCGFAAQAPSIQSQLQMAQSEEKRVCTGIKYPIPPIR